MTTKAVTSTSLSQLTRTLVAADFQRLGSLLPFAAIALVFVAMIPPTMIAMLADTRQFQGNSVWLKPLKFEMALLVFFGTVAFFGAYTSAAFRASRRVYWFALIACFAALAEIVWIGGAAFYGTASHFNNTNPFMATIYPIMGAFAVTLTASALIVGIAVLRHRDERLPDALRIAIGGSLIVTFFATVITAGYMSSSPGHLVGPESERAAHWLTGWSTRTGDLRVPHFFATHAMHFVPAATLAALWVLPKHRLDLFALASLTVYTGFTAFTLVQAISGQPLIAA